MELLLTRVSAARTRPAGTETDQAAPMGRAAALRGIGARPSCRAGPPGARTSIGSAVPAHQARPAADRHPQPRPGSAGNRWPLSRGSAVSPEGGQPPPAGVARAARRHRAVRSILCRQSKPEPTPYQCVRREGGPRSLARTRGTAMSANSKAASNAARASRGRRDRPRGDPVSRRPQRLSPWRRRQERTGGGTVAVVERHLIFPRPSAILLAIAPMPRASWGSRSAGCANKLRQYGNAGEPIAPPGGGGSDAVRRRLRPRTSCLEIGSRGSCSDRRTRGGDALPASMTAQPRSMDGTGASMM